MIISDGKSQYELDDDQTKDYRYKQLLANVVSDLIQRSSDPTITSRVNHDVLLESVRQPLLVSSRVK